MIKSRTNINPSLPPDSSGASAHTSKGQLMQLKKDQLLARAAGIRGVTISSNLTKEQLVELIMRHEGHEQEDEGVDVLHNRQASSSIKSTCVARRQCHALLLAFGSTVFLLGVTTQNFFAGLQARFALRAPEYLQLSFYLPVDQQLRVRESSTTLSWPHPQ